MLLHHLDKHEFESFPYHKKKVHGRFLSDVLLLIFFL